MILKRYENAIKSLKILINQHYKTTIVQSGSYRNTLIRVCRPISVFILLSAYLNLKQRKNKLCRVATTSHVGQ